MWDWTGRAPHFRNKAERTEFNRLKAKRVAAARAKRKQAQAAKKRNR